MKIEILGTGCAKCNKLEAHAKKTMDALKIDAQVEKMTDLEAIMSYGVMMTPALAIDGEVQIAGKVPGVAEITTMIATAVDKEAKSG